MPSYLLYLIPIVLAFISTTFSVTMGLLLVTLALVLTFGMGVYTHFQLKKTHDKLAHPDNLSAMHWALSADRTGSAKITWAVVVVILTILIIGMVAHDPAPTMAISALFCAVCAVWILFSVTRSAAQLRQKAAENGIHVPKSTWATQPGAYMRAVSADFAPLSVTLAS